MASVSVWATTRFVALAAGDVIPAVDVSDTTQSAHGSLLSITATNFFATIPVPVIVTSASANALAVGLTGATNSAFLVDASTALQVAGLKVTGAVTGGTVAVVTTDSGAATNLTINAKGTGTIGIGSVSTGRVTITPVCTITGALTATLATAAQPNVTSLGTLTALTVTPGTTAVQALTATTVDATTNSLFGAGAWPTSTVGRSGSRLGLFSSTESGFLFIADMQAGVGANRGAEIYLGARGTTAVDNLAYVIIRGERDSAVSGTLSTQFLFKTANAVGTFATALTLTSASGAVFVGAVSGITTLATTSAVGVGAAANTVYGLSVWNSGLTGTAQRGIGLFPAFNSSATSSGYGLVVATSISGTFTMTEHQGLHVSDPSKGTAAITTNYGLYVDALTAGGTNWSIYCENGNVSFRTSALATGATTGHLFIPTSAGAPTGVPASIPTGQVAMQYDSTNNFLYFYVGGAWKKSTVYA